MGPVHGSAGSPNGALSPLAVITIPRRATGQKKLEMLASAGSEVAQSSRARRRSRSFVSRNFRSSDSLDEGKGGGNQTEGAKDAHHDDDAIEGAGPSQ